MPSCTEQKSRVVTLLNTPNYDQLPYTAAYDYGKKFGGLLYNLASNASQQVMTHADKFVEGTVLHDFSQERDKFEEDQKSVAKNKGTVATLVFSMSFWMLLIKFC